MKLRLKISFTVEQLVAQHIQHSPLHVRLLLHANPTVTTFPGSAFFFMATRPLPEEGVGTPAVTRETQAETNERRTPHSTFDEIKSNDSSGLFASAGNIDHPVNNPQTFNIKQYIVQNIFRQNSTSNRNSQGTRHGQIGPQDTRGPSEPRVHLEEIAASIRSNEVSVLGQAVPAEDSSGVNVTRQNLSVTAIAEVVKENDEDTVAVNSVEVEQPPESLGNDKSEGLILQDPFASLSVWVKVVNFIRKHKWWCILALCLIVVVLAISICLGFLQPWKHQKSEANRGSSSTTTISSILNSAIAATPSATPTSLLPGSSPSSQIFKPTNISKSNSVQRTTSRTPTEAASSTSQSFSTIYILSTAPTATSSCTYVPSPYLIFTAKKLY